MHASRAGIQTSEKCRPVRFKPEAFQQLGHVRKKGNRIEVDRDVVLVPDDHRNVTSVTRPDRSERAVIERYEDSILINGASIELFFANRLVQSDSFLAGCGPHSPRTRIRFRNHFVLHPNLGFALFHYQDLLFPRNFRRYITFCGAAFGSQSGETWYLTLCRENDRWVEDRCRAEESILKELVSA